MFDEIVFVLHCCTIPKFGETKNRLLKNVSYIKDIIHVGHIKGNISYKYGSSVA